MDTPADAKPNPNRAAMFIVFLVVFIDLLGFGIVLPLLPRYAELYLGGVPDWAQGAALGGLYCVFSVMQFIFSPMWGRVSDRIGRRPILLLSLGGSVVFYGLFAFAASLGAEHAGIALALLFVSRLGAGIAGASVATAQAVIADVTTPEKRSKGMALIGAAFGIGFTFGPLIAYAGLEVFNDAPWAPGAVASGLSLVALLIAYRKLPETRAPGAVAAGHREFFSLARTREVLRLPTVGALVLIYFLAIFGFANFEATLSLFTYSAFALDNRNNFLVFAYVGFVLMVAQGGFYRRFAGKVPEEKLLKVGLLLMMLGLGGLVAVALTASPNAGIETKLGFAAALGCSVFGFAFVNPAVSSLVSKRAPNDRLGEVLGVNQSFAALGRILGPFLGLILFKLEPSRTLPYLAAALTLVVVVLLLPRVEKKSSNPQLTQI